MSYRTIILFAMVLVMGIIMASGAYAANYSGFNQYYYTDYYKPTVYYANPYQAPTYASTSYVGAYALAYPNYYSGVYAPNYYSGTYYPTTYYYNAYYAAYGYGPIVINYAPAYYAYPTNYRTMTFYKGDSGWGFSIGSGSVCGIYGYC